MSGVVPLEPAEGLQAGDGVSSSGPGRLLAGLVVCEGEPVCGARIHSNKGETVSHNYFPYHRSFIDTTTSLYTYRSKVLVLRTCARTYVYREK